MGASKVRDSSQRIHFGTFQADLRAFELYRGNEKIRLQGLPFQLLELLLNVPGEVVTREELRRRLWSGGAFGDFEAGLNTAIRKLRKALGDDPKAPRFIETIPRRGYRFLMRTKVPANRGGGPVDSLAVMPFEYEGVIPGADFLSDGITESLIHVLSELPALKKVIARNSVFRYKGREVPPRVVGRELGVGALLAGKLVQLGNKLSISVELLNTSDDRHIWGAKYERKLERVPALQDEIAREISRNLQRSLRRPKQKRRFRRHTQDSEAYQLYLRGRYYWNKRPAEGVVQKGIGYFEQAIEKDPKFVLPYVGLADSYNTLGAWESGATAPDVAFPRAKTAAKKALELDDSLAEAHTSLAYASLHFDWNWKAAETRFHQALNLNPNYSHLHHWYSHYLTAVGRTKQSLDESLIILELDPLDLIINVHLAWHYQMARQYLEAIDQARKTLEMERNFHWGYFFLGLAYEQMGEPGKAISEFDKSVELSGGSTVMLSALAHACAAGGKADRAVEILLDLKELSRSRYVSSFEIGLIHSALGEVDEAFEWLERAFQERSGWLAYFKVEPRLDALRSDKRFHDMLDRLGLPH